MATDQITALPRQQRGAGGKLRKPPPKKPPPSPYARPPETARRRWISKLVDPAYRLITGGATRILPSFFSTVPPPSALPCPISAPEDQDKWQTGDGHEDDLCRSDTHLLASKSTEMASTSDISGTLNSSSDLVLTRHNEEEEQSDKNRLFDIERLVKGKKFSRDEFDRLVEVLNSRAVADLSNVKQGRENTNLTSRNDDELAMIHGLSKVSSEQKHEESLGVKRGSSTPIGLPKVGDEIGASPIEIARAYMDSRASEAGFSSKSMVHTVESTVLHGHEAATKPYDPSLSIKSSTCWPGAVVQDAYVTPQSQSSRYGFHNFPRTPYSRTLLTKSKSKLINMQGNNSHISSTSLLQPKTTLYQQDKSKASESGYGSVGPIRGIRHKVGAQSSSRRSAYSSADDPSQRHLSGLIEGFTPVAKSTDPVGTSCAHKPLGLEVGVPTVHMHTSLMAKKILDHIERNIPTPKEKSAELKLAMKWKNPESSVNFSGVLSNEDNGMLKLKDVGPYKYNGLDGKKSTLTNEDKGNNHVDLQPRESTEKSIDVRKEGTLASDMNDCTIISRFGNDASTTKSFGGSQIFSLKSSKEDALKTLPSGSHPFIANQEKNPLTNLAASKPVLPPIFIKKPESKWTLASSDNGSGFTFPVSASSSVFSEPPTPSIMPLFSTGDQHQLKERSTEPSYSFGFKKSSSAVVFSFPSTSNTTVQNDGSGIKFNFGSTEKPRLSFSLGKNAVCC